MTTDSEYLRWLYDQFHEVGVAARSHPSHHKLFDLLYEIDFVWLIPNDDNRYEDGCDLRLEYAALHDVWLDEHWVHERCSFLEMVVALSRRCAFNGDGDPRDWFWELLDNLGVSVSDYHWDVLSYDHIRESVENCVWRRYRPNGHGGLFPLHSPDRDQTQVEIWYQMNAYLLERL